MWFFISGESLPFRINVWTILLREFIRFNTQIPFVLVSSLETCLVQKTRVNIHLVEADVLISVNFNQYYITISFMIKVLFAKYAVQFVCIRRYEYDIVITTGEWDNLALYPDVCAREHCNASFFKRACMEWFWHEYMFFAFWTFFRRLWFVST